MEGVFEVTTAGQGDPARGHIFMCLLTCFKELFVSFPAVHLEPKVGRSTPASGVYACPCYKTTTRAGTLSTTGHSTNFVLMIEVPSKEPCSGNFHKYVETYSAHWIKRAVALFTTLSY